MSIIPIGQALRDPNLFGAALGAVAPWETWLAVLSAAFGEPLNRSERRTFEKVAGGRKPPRERVRELWALVGRRGGKSRMAAAMSGYIATCVNHAGKLSPGETGYVLTLAASRAQASSVFAYTLGFLESSPLLKSQILTTTADEIRLRGGIVIGVHAANFRTVRGRTLLGVVFDEAAFWRDESSATPDVETYRAVVPALATTGGMLVGISSPYRKGGLLFTKFRDHFGKEHPDVLVVRGGTATFNRTIDTGVIARAREDDPAAALSEWDAEFRADLQQFLDDASIEAAIDHGRPLELPPREGPIYRAFVDASAGRHDAFCIGIAHREGDAIVVDVARGRKPPFDPASVAAEFAALAKEYRCRRIVGDAYAGEWVAQAFRDAGVEYVRSELPKSGLYLEGLPAFSRGAVSIPNHPQLIRELRLLERRVARSGKDSVDHGASGGDDFANVVFGAIWLCRPVRKQDTRVAGPIQVGAGPIVGGAMHFGLRWYGAGMVNGGL